jgi:hypothetical protein
MKVHMPGIRLFFGVIVVAFFAALMVNAGGDIEGNLFPVLTYGSHVYMRNDKTVCWKIVLNKFRDSDARSLAWTVEADGNPIQKAFLTPYDPEEGRMARLSERVKGGDGTRNRCFDLPPPLQGADRHLKLWTHVEYAVWHGLWLVPQDIGPIEIKAVAVNEPAPTLSQ